MNSNISEYRIKLFRIVMACLIIGGQLLQSPAQPIYAHPQEKQTQVIGTILTVGGAIIAGKSISGELQEIIEETGGVANETIENLKSNIDDTVALLSDTYQDNLSITIDSLDNLSQKKIQEFIQTLNRIDTLIKDNVDYTEAAVIRVMNEAAVEIQLINADIEERATEILLVFFRGTLYLIDQVVFNLILIIAIVAIGIGLLYFIWLLFRKQDVVNSRRFIIGLLMVGYLAFFSALIVPSVRYSVMVFTGIGLEEQLNIDLSPNIIGLNTEKIVIGETKEIVIIGENLLQNENIRPMVTIGNIPVQIKADTDENLVLDIETLILNAGRTEIVLVYPDGTQIEVVVMIIVLAPPLTQPDLIISNISTTPSAPRVEDTVQIQVKIENRGESPANGFTVELKAFASQTPGATQLVSSLDGNSSTTLLFTHVYVEPGAQTIVGAVDRNNVIPESNETNNVREASIQVSEQAPTPTLYPFIDSSYRFYEDNHAGGDLVCRVLVGASRVNGFTVDFTKSDACDNDETRSLVLVKVPEGTRITVYDNSGCSTSDDWTVITTKKDVERYTVPTYEADFEDSFVKVDYRTTGNLDGKVSCVRITPP